MINAQEFFTHALHDSEAVTALLAYTEDTAGNCLPNIFEYPCEEELGDNPGKPYIVVQNTGSTMLIDCKDDGFDSLHDNTTIEVTCVCDGKDSAKSVAMAARMAIMAAMDADDSDGIAILNSQYSDGGVMFDAESGNYFVVLKYQIENC